MGSHVYNVVKAPIGWALFCDRERIGGFVSSEAALEAATAFGANAVREGHSIQINVPAPELREIEGFESRPARWHLDTKYRKIWRHRRSPSSAQAPAPPVRRMLSSHLCQPPARPRPLPVRALGMR